MRDSAFFEAGWHSVDEGDLPPPNEIVEFGRDERVYRQTQFFARWSDFDPAFNVAGLWWRDA